LGVISEEGISLGFPISIAVCTAFYLQTRVRFIV
jgi:hypothetical protein